MPRASSTASLVLPTRFSSFLGADHSLPPPQPPLSCARVFSLFPGSDHDPRRGDCGHGRARDAPLEEDSDLGLPASTGEDTCTFCCARLHSQPQYSRAAPRAHCARPYSHPDFGAFTHAHTASGPRPHDGTVAVRHATRAGPQGRSARPSLLFTQPLFTPQVSATWGGEFEVVVHSHTAHPHALCLAL